MNGNATVSPAEFWGQLITPDRTPAPLLEQLLLGIGNYINKHVAPWDIQCLTPTKLAAFYRLVGGDHDSLFLDTPSPSLSFIYQSLGCFHTLQPDKDAYAPPTIPALTPHGFVRWQTVQLLLGPEEHVPFLQEAVKRFEITNPGDGGLFPTILPREALPSKPDLEMTEWHEDVAERLMLEAETPQARGISSSSTKPLDESDNSSVAPSLDEQSIVDAADYFSSQRLRPSFRPPNIIPASPPTHLQQQWPSRDHSPYHEQRRGSYPGHQIATAPQFRDGPTPTGPSRLSPRHRSRPQTQSSYSESSGSEADDDSSLATTDDSPPRPSRQSRDLYAPSSPGERRHSAHLPYNPSDYSQPAQLRYVQPFQVQYLPPQRPQSSGPPRANTRGLNVKWRDVNSMWDARGPPSGVRLVEASKGAGHGRERERSPLRGVGGRKYTTEGLGWR
ncbi:hypothetical protein MMC12_000461 [Toensbergia leucococca]|nr:hypothetical protein [Toensbergia leucococca]